MRLQFGQGDSNLGARRPAVRGRAGDDGTHEIRTIQGTHNSVGLGFMDNDVLCTLGERVHEADVDLARVLLLAVILIVISDSPGLHLFAGQYAKLIDQVTVELCCVWEDEEVIPVFYFSPFLH